MAGVAGVFAALGFASSSLLASPVSPPGDQAFVPGSPISADEVNARFDALISAIDDNALRLGVIQDPITVRYTSGNLDFDTTGGSPPVAVFFDGATFDNSDNAVTTSAAMGWRFTAPHSGRFLVTSSLNWGDGCGNPDIPFHGRVQLLVNGTVVATARSALNIGTSYATSGVTDIVPMDQDDELTVEAFSNCADAGPEILAGSFVGVSEIGGVPPTR